MAVHPMTELDFKEVIARFDEILDAVARGETFRVLREGRPVALMEPSQNRVLDETQTTTPKS
jgi:antitoxin (DNA-binding transcriptional repressor) of toxin-antitoxin stability system